MWSVSKGGRIDRLIVFAPIGGQHVPAGELAFEGAGHKRQSVFRYAASWMKRGGSSIDPQWLIPGRGAARSPTSPAEEVPLPFLDAMPDGWGQSVLASAYPDQFFGAGEYLAATGSNRAGELLFGHSPEGKPERWAPQKPVTSLPDDEDTLEELVLAIEAFDAGKPAPHHFSALVRRSADVGGARPKATLNFDDASWIAKFKTFSDTFEDTKIEAVCLSVASACGIEVPEHHVQTINGRSVLMVKRFDRGPDGERFAYSSAATLMGVARSTYNTDVTYADLAAKARQVGITPCEEDFFARMLVNCFLHNTDDHLRNHAFIRKEGRWRLSPAFDITLNRGQRLVLAPCAGVDPTPDPRIAFAAYPRFGMTQRQALDVYDRVANGMSRIRRICLQHGVSEKDWQTVSSAWAAALSPPPVSSLPVSRLIPAARSDGGGPVERLGELGIAVNLDTHEARKTGRGISIFDKASGKLDNMDGSPARVRHAWSTSPEFEYFAQGERVEPTAPPQP